LLATDTAVVGVRVFGGVHRVFILFWRVLQNSAN
jgi:hypothetical protein